MNRAEFTLGGFVDSGEDPCLRRALQAFVFERRRVTPEYVAELAGGTAVFGETGDFFNDFSGNEQVPTTD